MEQALELKPLSIIRLFETTKTERESFVTQIIEQLEEGYADPIETHLAAKSMEDIVKQLTGNETYKKTILSAAEKEGKNFTFHGHKFDIKEVGVKYDFSKCEDKELETLYAQAAELDKKIKDKEKFLKTVPQSGLLLTEEESGDTYKVYPPAKSSTTSVAVTLK